MTIEEPLAVSDDSAPTPEDATPEGVPPEDVQAVTGPAVGPSPRLPLRVLLFRGVLIVLILALGVAVFAGLMAQAPKLDTADLAQVRTRVVVFTPRPVPVQRQWRGYGTARALDATNVPARITATIDAIPQRILEGASVDLGELLVKLDDRDFRAEVDRLDAALAQVDAQLDQLDTQQRRLEERLGFETEDVQIAEEELARIRNLAERNVTSTQDVDRARSLLLASQRARTQTRETLDALPSRRAAFAAQRQGSEAQRSMADRNYERASITAPIAGVLQSVDVEPGEAVAVGQRVARIVDPRIIEVPVRLPAAARRFIAVGDAVVLRPTNQAGRSFEAQISRIAPEDDDQTRTVTAYALLNQEDLSANEQLAPGAFVEADISSGDAAPRLVVPRRSLRKRRVQTVVQVEGVSTILNVPVEVLFPFRGALTGTGLDDDQWAVLADGALPTGTAILATASSSVLDGEAVQPIAQESAEASP